MHIFNYIRWLRAGTTWLWMFLAMGHLQHLLVTWSCASPHPPLKEYFFISSLRKGMGKVHVCERSVRWGCQQLNAAQLSTAEKPGTTRAAEAWVSHVPAWSVLDIAQNSLRGQPTVGMMSTPWCGDKSGSASWVAAVNIPKGSMTMGTAYKSMKVDQKDLPPWHGPEEHR